MPLQLYDKEEILDACLTVFARDGYKDTSAAMLAEAAGVSKSLIFHHFKSKKELYLGVLERCLENARAEINIDPLTKYQEFFEAKEKLSVIKLEYFKRHPDEYKVLREAFQATPKELKADIEKMLGPLMTARDKLWEQLFDKVPLREGVDREQALELIELTLKHFENEFLAGAADCKELDASYWQRFLAKRNSFLDMIRYGIER